MPLTDLISGAPPSRGDSLTIRGRAAYLVMVVVLVLLLASVEVLLFRSYTNSEQTTKEFSHTTNSTTFLANVQRETMLVHRQVVAVRKSRDLQGVDMRWALLQRQVDILEGEARTDSVFAPPLRRIEAAIAAFDSERRATAGRPVAAVRRQLVKPLERIEGVVKQLFDEQEHKLYDALGATLRDGEQSQRLIAALGAFALVLMVLLAVFVRRSVRRSFQRAYSALANEVRERTALQDRLWDQARRDPLTGLPNRVKLNEELERAGTGGEPEQVAIVYVDLDGFKGVNDAFGHAIGDELLRHAAQRLAACIRSEDQLARLGGDEFAVLLRHDDVAQAEQVAARMLQRLEEPFVLSRQHLRLSASIGIATGRADTPADDLIGNADLAMYAVKNDGKGAVRSFDPGMRTKADARRELEGELREAIEQGGLELHYQPIVRLADGGLAGVEALVRWPHPERGLLPPSEFLSVADECGLMTPLGRWVLGEACRQAVAWERDLGAPIPWVSVNLAPRHLRDPNLLEHVTTALDSTGLDASRLVLEISEMALLDRGNKTIGVLERLRSLGVRLALDDFGAGYSSLSYLRFLPISILKIDRTFIQSITTEAEQLRMAAAILELGSSVGLETVAEGIEREEQLDVLRSMGCPMGQGFLFSRPQPAAELAAGLGDMLLTPATSAAGSI